MADELKHLQEISGFFKRMNVKIKLLGLINKAKEEYDKFDFSSCSNSLDEAYRLDPNNPVVLRGLGCLKQFEKNYDKAIEYYQKALEHSDMKEVEYTLIGMVYYLQDKLDDAVQYFNLAIDENEDYTSAYEGRNQVILENHVKILDLQESLKKYF